MGDSQEEKTKGPQEEKSKGPYLAWSPQETQTLLSLLVDADNQNWRDASGSFNKHTVEQRILPVLNKTCGSAKTYSNYRNRMKTLKSRYKSFADLLRHSSGFGWDPATKKFTAREDVWEDYFKGHPKDRHLRDDSFEDFEDLTTIFGQNIATGKHAVALGDNTDARTYGARDNEWVHDRFFHEQIDEDEDEDDVAELLPQQVGRNSNAKLPVRKKAKIDKEKMAEEINAVAGMNTQMFNMVQQRWEKEAEEKQAEEKLNNVWSAIKEIPDLEESVCFDTMTLVHQLGMKAGFVSMTIEERRGWIKRSVLKL